MGTGGADTVLPSGAAGEIARAVRGNGDEDPSWQKGAHNDREDAGGDVAGAGAPEAFPDDRQT